MGAQRPRGDVKAERASQREESKACFPTGGRAMLDIRLARPSSPSFLRAYWHHRVQRERAEGIMFGRQPSPTVSLTEEGNLSVRQSPHARRRDIYQRTIGASPNCRSSRGSRRGLHRSTQSHRCGHLGWPAWRAGSTSRRRWRSRTPSGRRRPQARTLGVAQRGTLYRRCRGCRGRGRSSPS